MTSKRSWLTLKPYRANLLNFLLHRLNSNWIRWLCALAVVVDSHLGKAHWVLKKLFCCFDNKNFYCWRDESEILLHDPLTDVNILQLYIKSRKFFRRNEGFFEWKATNFSSLTIRDLAGVIKFCGKIRRKRNLNWRESFRFRFLCKRPSSPCEKLATLPDTHRHLEENRFGFNFKIDERSWGFANYAKTICCIHLSADELCGEAYAILYLRSTCAMQKGIFRTNNIKTRKNEHNKVKQMRRNSRQKASLRGGREIKEIDVIERAREETRV